MPSLPGMEGEVFFGDAEKPLPDWRKSLSEEDDDNDELSEEEREAVIGMLGFDPSESDPAIPAKANPSNT